MNKTFEDPTVAKVFANIPEASRSKLLHIRELILRVGSNMPETGGLEETLRWGEPSYIPRKRSGTTVRLQAWDDSGTEMFGLFVNCQTSLITKFREMYSTKLKFSKNRGIIFEITDPIPEPELVDCVKRAFRYHLDKNR